MDVVFGVKIHLRIHSLSMARRNTVRKFRAPRMGRFSPHGGRRSSSASKRDRGAPLFETRLRAFSWDLAGDL